MAKTKPHYVVLKKSDGSPEAAPMKAWLRQNPEVVPSGLDPTASTSYQLRRALRKNGWELEELQDKVLLIKPDEGGDVSFADVLFYSDSDDGDTQAEDVAEAAE